MKRTFIILAFFVTNVIVYGQLGIGTTSPSGMLHIDPTTSDALIIDPFGTNAGETGEIQFKELATNGSNYIGLKAADDISASQVFTLPPSDGSSGQAIVTDGSGNLSWGNAGSGWEELATASPSATTVTMASGTFSARKYLKLFIHLVPSSGGMPSGELRFNGDGADRDHYMTVYIVNDASNEKLAIIEHISNTTGAGNAPERGEAVGKWINTSSQITSIIVRADNSGISTESEIIVLGRN